MTKPPWVRYTPRVAFKLKSNICPMYQLKLITLFCLIAIVSSAQQGEFPLWKKGYLDIHFISTGRGNSTFIVMPDGTSLLVDAGDLNSDSERLAPAVPNQSKTPGQWITDYIHQFHPKGKKAGLDYVLITHYHDDHIGSFTPQSEKHTKGNYKLSGITEVGSIVPVKKLIDSGEDFRRTEKDNETSHLNQLAEYRKFIAYQEKTNSLLYEKFRVGSSSQLKMKYHADEFPGFVVKNLFSNGEIAAVSDSTIAIRNSRRVIFHLKMTCRRGFESAMGFSIFIPEATFPGSGTPERPTPKVWNRWLLRLLGILMWQRLIIMVTATRRMNFMSARYSPGYGLVKAGRYVIPEKRCCAVS